MGQVFRIFFGAEGTRPYLVLLCLIIAFAFEAVGISTLLPAVALIAGQEGSNSPLTGWVNGAFNAINIRPTFNALMLAVAITLVLKSLISFGALTYAGITSSKVAIRLRQRLISALFNASWRFYSDQQTGSFANAISNDATRAGDAYIIAAYFIALVVQSVLYAIIAVVMDWRLALLGLVAGALMALMMNVLIRITRRAGFKQTDRTRTLTVDVVDMLANIKPLKTMHRYVPLVGSLQSTIKKLRRSLNTREIAKQGLTQGGDAVMVIFVAIVVFVAHSYWNTALAELLVGGVIFFRVIQNISKLQRQLQTSAQVESAYIRLEELIHLAEANREHRPGKTPVPHHAECVFENVSFSYGEAPVLRNVNLSIPPRGITVLKGPSGSGKTTIIDLFIGLHEPGEGTIATGGVPMKDADIYDWRSRIGYVPQELNLLHDTIRENITMGDGTISDEKCLEALKLAGAQDFIAGLPEGLETNVGEMGGKLSGGQRQRISLARALVIEPEVLILDEVTSALDPTTEDEIVRNIADLGGRYTIIAITHRPAWTAIADRLYEVAHGRVHLAGGVPARRTAAKITPGSKRGTTKRKR
jgi:ATP-binding cassette subfamily C protein